MEMRFQSKEESNRQQQAEFLKLSPAERFQAFLELSRRVLQFPTNAEPDDARPNKNFVLEQKPGE